MAREKTYISFSKLKKFFDEIFNKEGFDYYRANKILLDLILRSAIDKELREDDELKMLRRFPALYYKRIFLPSEKDIMKVLTDKNIDDSKKALVQSLLNKGIIGGVAYATKGIIEAGSKKGLGYIIAINSGVIPDLDKYDSLSKEEKISYLKTLGYFLTGLWYHETLGHGVLGHLEWTFFRDPFMDNLMEDLVINTRIERYLPKVSEALRNLGGVFYDTWYKFPDAVKYILKMKALLDPNKYENINGKIKPIDKEEFKKHVSKVLSKIEKNYRLAFLDEEDIPESLKNLKENYAKYIDNGTFINEFIKTLSQIAKNSKEAKEAINFTNFDKIFLNNFKELVSIFKNNFQEDWNRLTVYSKKPTEDYTEIDIDDYNDIYDVQQELPSGVGTLENGDVNKLDEIDDVFKDKMDKDHAKKSENVLRLVSERLENEIIKNKRIKIF